MENQVRHSAEFPDVRLYTTRIQNEEVVLACLLACRDPFKKERKEERGD